MVITPDTPKAQLASSEKYRTSLTVPITMNTDPAESGNHDQTIAINKELIIGGQTVEVRQASIKPTGIYVDIAYDEDNTMKIFDLIAPQIGLGEGEQREVLNFFQGGIHQSNGVQTLIFHNDNRNVDGPLTFEMEGIEALERSKLELINPYSGYMESRQEEKGVTSIYYFNIGTVKLPQPLTFKLNKYSNPIREQAAVRIR